MSINHDSTRDEADGTGVSVDSDKEDEEDRQPVHRFAYRTEDGLYIGIEGSDKAYLLNGKEIRVVEPPESIAGTAPMLEDLSPWTCDCGGTQWHLPECLEDWLPLDHVDLAALSTRETAEALAVWMYVAVLGKPTKPLLVLVGEPGSTKTSITRTFVRWLEGPKAEVLVLPKSPHDFGVVAAMHRVVGLDNVDMSPRWLQDLLAAAATGASYESRRLYTDDAVAKVNPGGCAVILTAMAASFNRADISDRAIVLVMRRLSEFLPEEEIERQIIQRRPTFWWCLVHDLNHLIALEKEQQVVPTRFRMADYAAVGQLVWGDRTEHILDTLQGAQAGMALRDDEVTTRLIQRVRRDGVLSGTAGELKEQLFNSKFDPHSGWNRPREARTAKGFGDHLRRIAAPARHVGLEITWQHDTHANANTYEVRLVGDDTSDDAEGQ